MERDALGKFIKGHRQLNSGRTHIKKGEKWRLGKKHSKASKRKMSIAGKGRIPKNIEYLKSYKRPRGADHPLWKGGTDESKTWRTRIEYKLWREAVYKRDNFTCQKCFVPGGKLHPHHIKSFSKFPELRFSIDNGITLCAKHHKEFHKVYGRKDAGIKEIEEYVKNN